RRLLGLVVFVQGREHGEAARDGAVKQVGFRESEHDAALVLPHLRRKGQRLAESQEVVRLVGEPDESSHQPADAALQADGLLALFLQFEQEVDGAIFGVALDLRGLVRIQLVEIVQLVQPQNTDFPGVLVEERAFVNQQFAADHFVARGGISGEVDAPDVVLLAFIELHGDVNALGVFVEIRFRGWHKVDESVAPVDFPVILERFAYFGGRKNVSLFQREHALQRVHLQRKGLVRIVAGDFQSAHAVALALYDRDGDVDRLPFRSSGKGYAEPPALRIEILQDRVPHQHLVVAVIRVQPADAHFNVLDELVVVVGLAEHIEFRYAQGNPVRPVIVHRADQFPAAEDVVPRKQDLSDFNFRTLVDFEYQDHRVARSNALVLRRHRRELFAMLRQEFLQHHFRFLDTRGVELALHRQPDLLFLEAVQDVRLGYRLYPVIADAANHRPLDDSKSNDFAARLVRRIFHA